MTGPVRVGIVLGSDSDLEVLLEAVKVLDALDVGSEVVVASAHRTPERTQEYASTAHARGIGVLIAGAGGAAALPGVLASFSPLPVIGVPVEATPLGGLDALLSIVQMPKGVPASGARRTPASWRRRSWRSVTLRWRRGWPPTANGWRTKSTSVPGASPRR